MPWELDTSGEKKNLWRRGQSKLCLAVPEIRLIAKAAVS